NPSGMGLGRDGKHAICARKSVFEGCSVVHVPGDEGKAVVAGLVVRQEFLRLG
ncbi:hypothetical protein COL922a_014902, partial [Colletotrichum nupharicola]